MKRPGPTYRTWSPTSDSCSRTASPVPSPPFGFAYGLETFLDEALRSLAAIYFEAGDHTHLVRVNSETFTKLMAGVRHGRFGKSSGTD